MAILAALSHRILSGQHGIRRPSGVKGIAQQKISDGDTGSTQPQDPLWPAGGPWTV
jgi:hypothetical protein